MTLRNAIQTRSIGVSTVSDELNALVPAIITRYNSEIGPTLLSRLPTEELPTDPRLASSFRSRVSVLVEYSVITMIAEFVDASDGLPVTFNTTNEFADFYFRDDDWRVTLRVDIKTLHDLSAEASARYTPLLEDIDPADDYLMFLVWQWSETDYKGSTVVFPKVLDGLFLPAIEVAKERDLRQILSRGSFDPGTGRALASSGNIDTNFGKMNRIVHDTRRGAADLAPRIQKLLNLMDLQASARSSEPAAFAVVDALADQAEPTLLVTEVTEES